MREHTIPEDVAANRSHVRLVLIFPKGSAREEESFHEDLDQARRYFRRLVERGRKPGVVRMEEVTLHVSLPAELQDPNDPMSRGLETLRRSIPRPKRK